MITKEIAETLSSNITLYHKNLRDSRGEPVKCRVNGKCKIWKTRPLEFKLPVKAGLYEYGYIENFNADEWCVDVEECFTDHEVYLRFLKEFKLHDFEITEKFNNEYEERIYVHKGLMGGEETHDIHICYYKDSKKYSLQWWVDGKVLDYNLRYYDEDHIQKQKMLCYICKKYVDKIVLIGFAGRCCPACREANKDRIEYPGWYN
jgi:hypothetical protein